MLGNCQNTGIHGKYDEQNLTSCDFIVAKPGTTYVVSQECLNIAIMDIVPPGREYAVRSVVVTMSVDWCKLIDPRTMYMVNCFADNKVLGPDLTLSAVRP